MESFNRQPSSVSSVVIRLAKDLDEPVRHWVSSLFGRPLDDEERVAVTLPAAAVDQAGSERSLARRQMLEAIDRIGDRFREASDQTLEAVLDEAMRVVRPSYEPRR